ncbi:MAG: hypothetical protein R3F37_07350 [Candidatus Competibacteraceae bacterium]
MTFVDPTSQRALYELQSLSGVEYGEPFREGAGAVTPASLLSHQYSRIESDGDRMPADTDSNRISRRQRASCWIDFLGKHQGKPAT